MDENLFDKNSEYIYEDKSIYILHYPMKKVHVSFGYGLQKVDEYYIKHLCSTEQCSSGSPILNLKSNNVIGIHSGFIKKFVGSKESKYNIGVLLKYPLNEMNKIINKEINYKTEIKLNIFHDYNLDENMNFFNEKNMSITNANNMNVKDGNDIIINNPNVNNSNTNKEKISGVNNIDILHASYININDKKNNKNNINKEIYINNNINEKLINNSNVINNNDTKNNNSPHFIKSTEFRLPPNLIDLSYDNPKFK